MKRVNVKCMDTRLFRFVLLGRVERGPLYARHHTCCSTSAHLLSLRDSCHDLDVKILTALVVSQTLAVEASR